MGCVMCHAAQFPELDLTNLYMEQQFSSWSVSKVVSFEVFQEKSKSMSKGHGRI